MAGLAEVVVLVLLLALGCGSEPAPSTPDPSTPAPSDTGDGETPQDTAAPTDPRPWDCDALPVAPLDVVSLPDMLPSEDFAFDDEGHLISHWQTYLVKQTYPPSTASPWSPTLGGSGGPASIRALSNGDIVYHNVDTGSLYRVEATGAQEVVYSGFGYAGGIEVHPSDWIYVVDLLGLHRIEPYTRERIGYLPTAPWSLANGITLSRDGLTLFVSAWDGIWAMPVDADGVPTAPPVPWAPAPANTWELMGMGVDDCGNLYVAGTTFSDTRLWRYRAAGAQPEVLLQLPSGKLSNLQWGSGIGGFSATHLYVVDQGGADIAFYELAVGVGDKPR